MEDLEKDIEQAEADEVEREILEDKLLKTAQKFLAMRGFNVLDKDLLVYLDEDEDTHIVVQVVQGWEEDPVSIKQEFERKLLEFAKNGSLAEGMVICDLFKWIVVSSENALLQHVVGYPIRTESFR